MLEGVGGEGQVQVEYLAEQGLDLSKVRRVRKAEANLFCANLFKRLSQRLRYVSLIPSPHFVGDIAIAV